MHPFYNRRWGKSIPPFDLFWKKRPKVIDKGLAKIKNVAKSACYGGGFVL
jgi:hypothetical protein